MTERKPSGHDVALDVRLAIPHAILLACRCLHLPLHWTSSLPSHDTVVLCFLDVSDLYLVGSLSNVARMWISEVILDKEHMDI